jgi:hypothetical protein
MARKDGSKDQEVVSYAGEEELRFIRSFHDVFLSIGLTMLIVGLYTVSEILVTVPNLLEAGSPLENASGHFLFRAVVFGGLALVSWGLAEVFARTRRQALPSMVLFIFWIWFVFFSAAVGYLGVKVDVQGFDQIMDALKSLRDFPLFMSVVLTIASLVFYLRMKLPFAMGAVGLGLASFLFSIFIYREGWGANGSDQFSPTLLTQWIGAGVVLFVLGLYFDARDPERRTRLSDNGFWLHLFAAPILFTGIMNKFGPGGSSGEFSPGLTLVIIGVFAFISLLINRRALLVSGLLTAAYAIAQIAGAAGLDGMWGAATTLITLGGAMVLLGGAWHRLRGLIIAPFPKSGPIARIIPPVTRTE